MDYKDLIALIDHLDQSSVSYVDYQTGSQHLVLSKELPQVKFQPELVQTSEHPEMIQPAIEMSSEAKEEISVAEMTEVPEEKIGAIVESPMVGVAYLQANPDEEPYVKVGDRVEQGDVICLIEAMKLMNEIQAPHAGTVTEILVKNEEVVEFNQGLIRIEE